MPYYPWGVCVYTNVPCSVRTYLFASNDTLIRVTYTVYYKPKPLHFRQHMDKYTKHAQNVSLSSIGHSPDWDVNTNGFSLIASNKLGCITVRFGGGSRARVP